MHSSRSFTLIELMIVVAIIAFLSTLSMPHYFRYLARAKQAEVAVNLASLYTAQQLHYAERGSYNSQLSGDGGIGWQPSKNAYYTYGFYHRDARDGMHYFIGKLKAQPSTLAASRIQRGSFIAVAAADLLGKNNLDIWTIDEDKNLVHLRDGITQPKSNT